MNRIRKSFKPHTKKEEGKWVTASIDFESRMEILDESFWTSSMTLKELQNEKKMKKVFNELGT